MRAGDLLFDIEPEPSRPQEWQYFLISIITLNPTGPVIPTCNDMWKAKKHESRTHGKLTTPSLVPMQAWSRVTYPYPTGPQQPFAQRAMVRGIANFRLPAGSIVYAVTCGLSHFCSRCAPTVHSLKSRPMPLGPWHVMIGAPTSHCDI